MIDLVRLLGYRWFRKRAQARVSFGLSTQFFKTEKHGSRVGQYVLDPLEPRVLLSAEPILMAAPSHDDSATALITTLLPYTEFDESDLADAPFTFSVGETDEAPDATTLAGATTIDDPDAPTGTSEVPLGADFRDTSEYMLGTVLVTVVLFESDGGIDANLEDWDQARIDKVKLEIIEGLNWWEDTLDLQNSLHALDFIVDFTYADAPVATGYEPITRAQSQDSLWINDFLDAVDYNTGSSHFTDLNHWNHDQRVTYGTDWAYTVFVADSLADGNGKFSDDYFAYAYLGGPYVMMTYDNNGWGSSRMGQVFAHETGHIFYALDEYPGSTSYNTTSGYYNTQNLNASDGHPNPGSRVDSIMAESSKQGPAYSNHTSSPSSLEMIGWRDSDGDGIFDVLDVPLTLTGSGSFDAEANVYSFSGQSSVNTLNNLSPSGTRHDITINTVDLIQYSIDGGEWIDGNSYGLHDTPVAQAVLVTVPGNHTIEFRTIVEQTGLSSNIIVSDSFFIEGVIPGSVTVTPTSGLVTTETGGGDTFDVVLDSQPTADVTIAIASSNTDEGTVSTGLLTFTPDDWDTPQPVTVTGKDDDIDDGDTAYTIFVQPAVSVDLAYAGVDPDDVSVTNSDDDTAGVTVTPTSGVVTTEAGGTDTFDVVLDSQPTADVTIAITSSNTDEGTVSTGLLTFTPDDWDTPQTVTVTGENDDTDDGDTAYTVFVLTTLSADPAYAGVDPDDVAVTNNDDDTAGVTVTPTSGLVTTEAGGTDTFDVALDSKPTADVTIAIASSNTDEGTVSTSLLTFTPDDWDTPQTVTVTGENDDTDDGDIAYTVFVLPAISADAAYDGVDPDDVAVTNLDDDEPAPAGLSISLNDYTIISYGGRRNDNGVAAVEDDGATLHLTGNTWKKIQLDYLVTENTVIEFDFRGEVEGEIHGIGFEENDTLTPGRVFQVYGTQAWGIEDFNTYTTGQGWAHYTIPVGQYYTGQMSYLVISNDHDDSPSNAESLYTAILIYEAPAPPGITVTPTSGLVTTEAGGFDTFDVVLDTQPTADVTIAIASSNTDEGTVSTGLLTFTPDDWDAPQTVTVTGANDDVDDDDAAYTIFVQTASSSDAQYDGIDPDDVAVTNTDDDTAGVTVTPTSGLVTTEAGGFDTFDVVLDSQPTADVTIAIASSNTDEGTASTSLLTFTPDDWDTPQTVTVTGGDDDVEDGDAAYTVFVQTASSSDAKYDGIDPDDVAVTNTDDDALPPNAVTIDFTQYEIRSYTGGEDKSGTVTIEDGGDTLHLQGNLWKKIDLDYLITPTTVLEFDFRSEVEGEIHGIGFDNNNSVSMNRVFRLNGDQGNAAILDYSDYTVGEGTRHYTIPVGQFYTGEMRFLIFINDHDAPPSDGDGRFSNIVIYEDSGQAPAAANTPSHTTAAVPPKQPVSLPVATLPSGIFTTALGPYAKNHTPAKRPRVTVASVVLGPQPDNDTANPWDRVATGYRLSRYRG